MSLSLEQLRNAFKKETTTGGRLNNYYPFHLMQTGEQATIRFLPDANKSNPLGFLVERRTHTLTINGQKRNVPCRSNYGEDCPICKVSSAYYNANDKENGKRYWRKLQYLAQVLVVENPLPTKDGEESATGTVKIVTINPQLHTVIKAAFESGELESIPYNFEDGTDFIIRKDQQGDYASYIMSRFKKRESALDDEQVEYVLSEMKDLSTFLPKCPSLEEVEALLNADITGEEYKVDAAPAARQPDPENDEAVQEAMERLRARKAASVASDEFDDDVPPAVTSKPAVEAEDDGEDDIIAQLKRRRQGN